MTDSEIATALAALGHEARLKLFRLLVRAGPEGLSVGEIGRHLAIPPSTLAHHLGALVAAGLVTQEKRGRAVISRAEYALLNGIFAAVEAECCAGVARLDDDTAA